MLGENGAGKSSVSQSIMLLKQTFSGGAQSHLQLNGPLVKIGNGVDALSQSADEDSIEFSIEFDSGRSLCIKAKYEQDSDFLPIEVLPESDLTELEETNLVYLSADRLGPQLLSSFSAANAATRRVSERGENALALLHAHRSATFEKDDPRVVAEMDSLSVKSAFDHYLSQISTGASIEVQGLSNLDSVASTFSFGKTGMLPTERIRPTNVGFGLSYSASIIIACLLAREGDLLIIENPEAHLHTKGQRALCDLFTRTSEAGVQIICETHSREFLYHIRRQIADNRVNENICSFNLVYRNETGSKVSEWFPVSRPFSELGEEFENFLDFFGTPMDFIQPVRP